MSKRPSWRDMVARKRYWLLVALMAATTASYLFGLTERLDLGIYDSALPGGPRPKDITLVAIDDRSFGEMKQRWPWNRAYHAQLLRHLLQAGVRSVALELLMPEADQLGQKGDSDQRLAEAMRDLPTVLPSFPENRDGKGGELRERLPIPQLLEAAAGIGHAQVVIDADGIVRSIYLREGSGAPNRFHIAAELLARTPHEKLPAILTAPRGEVLRDPVSGWARQDQILIPYLGPPGHFQQVSYVDVLGGKVNQQLKDQIVIVGLTAAGMGAHQPTPLPGLGHQLNGPMAGIEVTANVLQALRTGTWILPVNRPLSILLALLPVLVAASGLLHLAPRPALLLVLSLFFGTLGLSVLLLRVGWWWPPATPMAALVVVYPFWSWLRLEATQAFLEDQFVQLARERFPLLSDLPRPQASRAGDFVQQRLELLRQATDRLRSARSLFANTINSLPDATILADVQGQIVLANPAAAALFGYPSYLAMEGEPMSRVLRQHTPELPFDELAQRAPCTQEITLAAGSRHLLVRSVPFHDGARRVGTLVDLTDITELREAQREREDVVRFLSHDMKSPATSLMGLAQLQRDPSRALPAAELSQRLDLLAARMLTLLDSFVSLARAETADPAAFESFDLRDAVQDAYDEVWAAAQMRRITITPVLADDPCTVAGDRRLLARAVVNLLSNAIKFSPYDGAVELRCRNGGRICTVQVLDHGPGIQPQKAAALFQRFSRGMHAGERDPGGAGLGLAFVRVVAEKHRGRVWAEPNAPAGTVFSLALPAEKAE